MIAIDSNLLIYAHWSTLPQHKRAVEIIDEATGVEGGWGIPLPCIGEFWTVVTHPAAKPSSPPHEANAFLNNLWQAGAAMLDPKPGIAGRLTTLASDLKLGGPRIFDLQIALISFEAGAREIWTNDRGFPRIAGLSVRHTNLT